MCNAALLLCCRSSRGCRGAADGLTVDDEFDAAIALAAFWCFVGSDGLRFAKAASGDRRTGHTLFRKKIADGIGAAFS